MRVTLLSFTPEALELLLFTKQTRLSMNPETLDSIRRLPLSEKLALWKEMQGTIQSSWEFVVYVFLIEEVTRAFTHQLVRHRIGTSFAQQSQRAVDMSGFGYEEGPSIRSNAGAHTTYDETMRYLNRQYGQLIRYGANHQDARGILPTNIHTNIIFQANLRTLHTMALERMCVRTQAEFQDVFLGIREAVVAVHPWTEAVLRPQCGWNATCLFPNLPLYECAIKPFTFNPQTGVAYGTGHPRTPDDIQSIWEKNRTSPQPRALKVLP